MKPKRHGRVHWSACLGGVTLLAMLIGCDPTQKPSKPSGDVNGAARILIPCGHCLPTWNGKITDWFTNCAECNTWHEWSIR
jgi:hypothetical protein